MPDKQDETLPSISLNTDQEQAIKSSLEPLLVIAGPGSGKTRTLIERVKHLCASGVSLEHILILTFTRRAAGEIQERLPTSYHAPNGLKACTLHALAFEWHNSQQAPALLLDDDTAKKIFLQLHPDLSPKALKQIFSDIARYREEQRVLPENLAELFTSYSDYKTLHNLVDYTDLLENYLLYLRISSTQSWEAVLVDEIQDLSKLQLEVISALLPKSGQGFFGIGDPDQAIYGFRGAYGQVQEFFLFRWPSLRNIHLQINYRSAPIIVQAAGRFISKFSASGKMFPAEQATGQITLFTAPTATTEAIWIAEKINLLLGSGSHTLTDQPNTSDNWRPLGSGELSPSDVAILVRSHALIPSIKKVLEEHGITPRIPEKAAFWQDPSVEIILDQARTMLGMLEAKEPPIWDYSLLARGPQTLQKLAEQQNQQFGLLQSNPLNKIDDVFWKAKPFRELTEKFNEYKNWSALLSWIHLQNELEAVAKQAEQVQIMTIHAAKGLEFRAVFMPCLEEGILPIATQDQERSALNNLDINDERRLFYVGITRARQSLFLSHANKRQRYGQEVVTDRSRFLSEMPEDCFEHRTLIIQEKKVSKQLLLY